MKTNNLEQFFADHTVVTFNADADTQLDRAMIWDLNKTQEEIREIVKSNEGKIWSLVEDGESTTITHGVSNGIGVVGYLATESAPTDANRYAS